MYELYECCFARVGWAFLLSSGAALKVNQRRRKNYLFSLIAKDYHTIRLQKPIFLSPNSKDYQTTRWLQCDGDGVIGTELGRPLQLLQQVPHCWNHKTFFLILSNHKSLAVIVAIIKPFFGIIKYHRSFCQLQYIFLWIEKYILAQKKQL